MTPAEFSSLRIVLVGAGNVGWHLGRRLHQAGGNISVVFSRNEQNASALASQISSSFTSSIHALPVQSDVYIIAVRDDAIETVAAQLSKALTAQNPLVVHTSGATPGALLRKYFGRFGVLYPLQTFTKTREPVWEEIPLCIEANQPEDLELLSRLAMKLSPHVHHIPDDKRAVLHVAAVFVNNFTNHLYRVGRNILHSENIPFDLLKPLILETARKVQDAEPASVQTGPARRGDAETIRRHLEFLRSQPDFQHLYDVLTKSIIQSYSS